MEAWTIWLLVALGIFISEIFTSGFALACLSIGALGSSVTSLMSDSLNLQIAVFVVVTALFFAFVRPIVLKSMCKKSNSHHTNQDALIGREGIISEEFKDGGGRVKIDGDDWKAVCEDETLEFKIGEKVIVTALNSVILTIKKR